MFRKSKTSIDGYQPQCKSCISNQEKEYREKHKDQILKSRHEYYEKNKIKDVEYKKEYYKLNKNKMLQQHKDNQKLQRYNNPIFRLIENNRVRIRQALKSNSKASNTIELLGCSKEFFSRWINWQLPHEMDDSEFKENYEIDHCRPIATFDLFNPENQYDAFHWSNCQPLLKSKNRSKGAKRNLYSAILSLFN